MTASRPARALRDAMLVMTLVLVLRLPAIERRFAAALLAGADPIVPPRRPRAAITPMAAIAAPADEPAGGEPPGRRGAVGASTHPAPPAAMAAAPAAMAAPGPPSSPVVAVAQLSVATPPLPPLAAVATAPDAGAFATAAYARLAAGDRRGAVRLFDAALAGDDPRAAAWRRQRAALTRRWSGSAYSIVRGGGDPALGVTPVLGGGQSGGGIAFTPDPLAPRHLAVTLRGSVAHDDAGRSAFAAVGLQWHPVAGVTVAAERLIAVGPAGPNAWTVRLAGGIDRTFGRLRATAYGEGGVIGTAAYAAVQGRAAGVFHLAHLEFDPGVGVWSSVQRDRGTTVDRADVGPGLVARFGPFAAEVDYRVRVAGNAAPGSGPVVTLSAAF